MSTHTCNDTDEGTGKAASKEDDEADNTFQDRMIVPGGQGVLSQNSLGDSNVPHPSSSNATSQEAISVLLRAAMTSEPRESIDPSPNAFAGGVKSTSTAPLNYFVRTHAVAQTGQNPTGNSEPMNSSGVTTVDNNLIRAAIAAQAATTREPSAALGQTMSSTSTLPVQPLSNLTGFIFEHLTALNAGGNQSTSIAPMSHSINIPAAPERHVLAGNAGFTNPPGGMTVDNNLLRAVIASQAAAAREQPGSLGQQMSSTSPLPPLGHLTGLTFEHLAALTANGIQSASPTPVGNSINTPAVPERHNHAGNSGPPGGMIVDNNLIRAVIAAQAAAAREPPTAAALEQQMPSTSSLPLPPFSNFTGLTLEHLAALTTSGLIHHPPAAPPQGPGTMQDVIALLSAILMQQSAPRINHHHGGIDAVLANSLSRILLTHGISLTSPSEAPPTDSTSLRVPTSSSNLPVQGSVNGVNGILASLLTLLYNSSNAVGLNSGIVNASLQLPQQHHTAASTTPSFFVPLARATSSATGPVPSANDQLSTNSSFSRGRSRILHVPSDDDLLSPYQCLVRKQIEVFQASKEDIHASAQGRNRPIILGQVGIRCVHCGALPIETRSRGAVYFPSTLMSTYQTAQNMANSHLLKDCRHIPKAIREDLIRVRLRENSESQNTRKSAFGGGRSFWARGLRTYHGVVETPDKRLRFENDL